MIGLALVAALLTKGCITDHPDNPNPTPENPATFRETAVADLGGAGAAEIAAYDPISKRLFVVNNESVAKVEVLDVSALGGVANSVAVSGGSWPTKATPASTPPSTNRYESAVST